jgi:ankyrin repeat protein
LEQADSFPNLLISKGSELNATVDSSGDSLLHLCARQMLEKACVFLVNKQAKINLLNNESESVLHIACENGLGKLVSLLLEKGADPNVQTSKLTNSQTPLHKAILNRHEDIVDLFIGFKMNHLNKSTSHLTPDFNLKDSDGQTVLSFCLWNGNLNLARKLIQNGRADVDVNDNDDIPLLHQAILRQCTDAALFLLDQKVDINKKSSVDGLTALQLAVKRHLPLVVENLCKRGADMCVLDLDGNSPLWTALDTGQEDIASILVANRCDTTQWSVGPDKCQQTLLHRAIDENNDAVAVFLIKSGCDINSARRPGLNGEKPDESKDGMTPLHLACSWGQEKVVATLVEYKCNLNVQDAEGNTPLHIAILNQHPALIEILIRQSSIDLKIKNLAGQTPFAAALVRKNNTATALILRKEKNAAEQTDSKGRNFLHLAVIGSDIETVLSLLSVNVNVNSRVQDAQQKTSLHLAVEAGNEMIVRNLLLAGANANDLTNSTKRTALHLVAECTHVSATAICQVLLENNIDYRLLDAGANNALHIAVQNANLSVIKILLMNSNIDVYAVNSKGLTPIHILAVYGRENSSAILDLFVEFIKEFNLDQKDSKGNTGNA